MDQENDEIAFGVIGRDRLRNVLQNDRFTCPRRRNDQGALSFIANWRNDVDHTG